MVFSKDEEEVLYLLRLVFGCLNAAVIIVILIVYWVVKDLHYFLMRLVVYMIIADLLRCVVLLLDSENPAQCVVQAVFLQYSLNSGIFWALNIGIALFLQIVQEVDSVEDRELWFIGLGYGIPFGLAVVPFFFHGYGRGGGWCWISNDHNDFIDLMLRVICFYLPLICVILCCVIFYSKVIRAVHEHLEGFEQEAETSTAIKNKLVYYPMVLIVCYVPLFVKGAWEYFSKSEAEFVFTGITIVFTLCSGLLNAVVYGYNTTVRGTISRWLRRGRSYSRISLPEFH